MEKISYYVQKYKFFIIIFSVVLTLLFIASLSFITMEKDKPDTSIIALEEDIKENKEENREENINEEVIKINKVKVDIKGLVKTPGVYELDETARVIDVINKAGGLAKEANTEYINLSKKIKDEMIIIIYSNDEIKNLKNKDEEKINIVYECDCPDNINDACISKDDIINTDEKTDNNSTDTNIEESNNLISINSATKEELTKLNGIGSAKAQAIIDYRNENGPFEKLEDIMNVSGIGEAAYSKIKDYIKL